MKARLVLPPFAFTNVRPEAKAPMLPHMQRLREFINDENGQGLVEYALIIALVSVVAIAALNFLGTKANNSLSNAAAQLS